jgi:Cdc6-like AAA superfamily ATPase
MTEIENAFQPAREISSANKFAGRRQAVLDCYYAMISEGSNIAIIGNRGIGKTSLARQLINIASGRNELLKRLELPSEERLDFLPIYFACGDSVNTYGELLTRLLTVRDCLFDWVYDIPKAKKELETLSPVLGVSAGLSGLASLKAEFQGEKSTESISESAVTQHSIEVVFTNVLHAIVEAKIVANGVLIVVDEFDRIKNPSGFASFLKSLATNIPLAKFAIVGVAQDIQKLMKEHESADRLFAGSIIKLPPMNEEELAEIIHIAENSINHYITFNEQAVEDLVSLAQGHPYMVHLVGKYALRLTYRNSQQVVSAESISQALQTIAERGADPILEERYKRSVRSSLQRETVLKALAETQADDGEIWTSNAYKLAIDQGVDNASQYVGQLVTEEYGAEIVKVRDRYYRFRDSLFAAYVRARPSAFSSAAA